VNNWIRLQIKIQDDCPLDYTTAKTFAKAFEAALMKFTSVEQVVLEDWLPRKEQERRENKMITEEQIKQMTETIYNLMREHHSFRKLKVVEQTIRDILADRDEGVLAADIRAFLEASRIIKQELPGSSGNSLATEEGSWKIVSADIRDCIHFHKGDCTLYQAECIGFLQCEDYEVSEQDKMTVDLIHDALAEFCPDQCDWGHQVDVARYIGEGDIENWLKKRKVENAADNC